MGQHLGQHFLTDKNILQKIADTTANNSVIEIGPGHGELTKYLLDKNPARQLTAIERDPCLAELFRKRFISDKFPNVTLIEGDVRKELPLLLDDASHPTLSAVVGNIPYYLSGFLFRILGESETKPAFAVFTVQKEVAERASASTPSMNLLSASLQIWATPNILFEIPPEAFSPPPKVRSAVLSLATHNPVPQSVVLFQAFRLIRVLFRQPRKKAISNLLISYPNKKEMFLYFFSSHLLPENARPQEFSAELILSLVKELKL